jgi:two-component system, sensor histidine kinase and response regulator
VDDPESARSCLPKASHRRPEQLLEEYFGDPQTPRPDEILSLVSDHAELDRQVREMRQTQEQLKAYRDRYIDLYDFAPLGYVTLDSDGYVQEINLAGAAMLGQQRDALTGYPFTDYVVPEDRPAFAEHVRQCAGEHRDSTSEMRLTAKDGQSIVVQLHSVPIEGSDDDTLCKTAITDITERKSMEETIRRSQAFLQLVIDAIPEAMLVIGRDYRIFLINRAARQMAKGGNSTACVACYQLSHHRDSPCEGADEPCPLRHVLTEKTAVTVMHTHFDASDNKVFVEVSAAPVFDDAGEVIYVIEACRDVTARKRAEDALQQEQLLLRTLIDNLPDCIYVKDANRCFLAANLPTARLMDASAPDDLLGKTDADFYPPSLAAEYRADEEELLRSGRPLVDKVEPRMDVAGKSRAMLTTKVPLKDGRGNIVGLVGITRDIITRETG